MNLKFFFGGKVKLKLLFLSIVTFLSLASCVDNTPIHDIDFVTNGGTPVESHRIKENELIVEPTTEKVGHTLVGWFKEDTLDQAKKWDFSTHRVDSSITLYAQWSVNSYTISFNSNGGSSVPSITRPYGSQVSKPTNPTRQNYIFVNWYTDSSLTSIYSFSTMPAQNLTLFAKWNTIQVSSVTFTYDKLGLAVGEYYQILVTVLPSNASNKTLTWNSSNTSVATVSSSGYVYAKSVGYVTISATSQNGINETASLTVFYDVGDRILYESEPNGYKSSADSVISNGTTIYASNSSKSDLDYYSVYLSSNSLLSVIFSAEYTIDNQYYMIGIENSSTVLAAIYGSSSSMQYRVSISGTYYIGVLYSSSSPYSNGDLYGLYVYWF